MSVKSTIAQHVTQYCSQLKTNGLHPRLDWIFQDEHCKEILWSVPNFNSVGAFLGKRSVYLAETIEYQDFAEYELLDANDSVIAVSQEQQALLRGIFRRMATMWVGYVFDAGDFYASDEGLTEIVSQHPKNQLLNFSDLDSWKEGIQAWINSRTEEDATKHFNALLADPNHRLAWYLAIQFYHGRSTFLTDLYSQERFALETWNIDGQTAVCQRLWDKAIAHFQFDFEPKTVSPLQIGREAEWVRQFFSGLSIEESRLRFIELRTQIEEAQRLFQCRWIVRDLPTVAYYEPKGDWMDWDKISEDYVVQTIEFYDANDQLIGTVDEDPEGYGETYIGSTLIPTGSMMNKGPQRIALSYSAEERQRILQDVDYAGDSQVTIARVQ